METTRIALVFPGQGSQAIGMLKSLSAQYPIIKETFGVASDVIGYDLWQIAQDGPETRLNQTTITQPALLAADVACYRAWIQAGGQEPSWVAGHSLGEYAALVGANALDFSDAVRLVADRARFMQEAVPEGVGAMAAILGLDDADVEKLCMEHAQGEVLAAVNYNAPGQVVIAGIRTAVDRLVAAAKGAGAKRAILLPVSVPSHCALMVGAAKRLEERIEATSIHMPLIPVIHNVNVGIARTTSEVRMALVQQLYSPVRWVETIQYLSTAGAHCLVECGPGKVLSGLNKRIANIRCFALGEPADMALALAPTSV